MISDPLSRTHSAALEQALHEELSISRKETHMLAAKLQRTKLDLTQAEQVPKDIMNSIALLPLYY